MPPPPLFGTVASRMKETAIADYETLQPRMIASIREGLTTAEFGELAMAAHAFQRRWNAPYARWCVARPVPRSWKEIPAVPQAAFKEFRISCFAEIETPVRYLTSGTTGERRGEHWLRDTALYEASVLAGWRRIGRDGRRVFLAPLPENAPNSSLAQMFGMLAGGLPGGGHTEFMCHADWRPDFERLETLLFAPLLHGEPVAIFGTALGFLSLFEWMGSRGVQLKRGSFAVETGGFKGSGRDIPKAELYEKFGTCLGLKPTSVLNEYGMCELGSQFYATGLGGVHTGGPWVRALVVAPHSGREVAVGETGVLRIFDLANLGSVLAVQTADLAIRRKNGFELLGRDPAATPRGCSRVADAAVRGPVPFRKDAAPGLHTPARAKAVALAAEPFLFLGKFYGHELLDFLSTELGYATALDGFVASAGRLTRAIAPGTILHILSGNTPAAALQSLIRGLLLGSHNRCKLPAEGIPEVDEFINRLPKALQAMVETRRDLPTAWLASADAVIVFGSDETVAAIRAQVQPWQTFIAHGHKISFAVVFDDPECQSALHAARDVAAFDQQGCLSPHVIFVREHGKLTVPAYARRLAKALEGESLHNPRRKLSPPELNRIAMLRDETAFRAANGVATLAIAGRDFLVVTDSRTEFTYSPLNRVIHVRPLAEKPDFTALRPHLSTCGIFPATDQNAATAAEWGVSRVCPIGRMQNPPLAWHHDGAQVLAPLVRWVDFDGYSSP